MSEMYVNLNNIKGLLYGLKDVYKSLYNYSDDLNLISSRMDGYIDSVIISELNKATINNEQIAQNIEKLRTVLKDIL